MKKVLTAALLLWVSVLWSPGFAQRPETLIKEDIHNLAGIYSPYPDSSYSRTPAPEGYRPFYISHLGRHGSRWHSGPVNYERSLAWFRQASEAGKLTPEGKEVYGKVIALADDARDRYGMLSPRGEREHRHIAERMYRSFPEVFSTEGGKECNIDAYSSTVVRCVMSMTSSIERLKELNPEIKVTRTTSERLMKTLFSIPEADLINNELSGERRAAYRECVNSDRIIGRLFTDGSFIPKDSRWEILYDLYMLASICGDVDYLGIDLFRHLTVDECYPIWKIRSAGYYLQSGPSARFGERALSDAGYMLRHFISCADSAILKGDVSATMRYGHDINVIPLSALMGIKDCSIAETDFDRINEAWCDFIVTPMGCNIQMVFFKGEAAEDDILVEILMNEREAELPVEPVSFPFYRWSDVREYFLSRLDEFPRNEERMDSVAFSKAKWNWKPAGGGAEYVSAKISMFNSVQAISAVRYPADRFRTIVIDSPGKDRGTVSALGSGARADVAINGGYFNMKTLYPTTYVRVKGRERSMTGRKEIAGRSNGAIAFGKNDMQIFLCDTAGYGHIPGRYKDVIAAGPVLVEDGKTVEYSDSSSFYTSRHPRSIIGYTADGMVYMIVIDGRFEGLADGATIKEAAFVARMFGLEDALNLDGGGSSALWTDETGVLNHPSDNRLFDSRGEREVPNCIIATAK